MIPSLKSKLRRKLLVYYFSQPGAELYLRELARIIKEDPTNLSRELEEQEKEGLFISVFRGKQKYYKLNKDYPFYQEFRNIVSKSVGIENKLQKLLEDIKGIQFCFIFGSYAKGEERPGSDLDLFILGEKVELDKLLDKVNHLEKAINREINYRFFSSAEFKQAIKEKNSFVLNVLKNKKIFLIGNEKDFRKINK